MEKGWKICLVVEMENKNWKMGMKIGEGIKVVLPFSGDCGEHAGLKIGHHSNPTTLIFTLLFFHPRQTLLLQIPTLPAFSSLRRCQSNHLRPSFKDAGKFLDSNL
ncbi:hypothetical protein COLO4_00062 [Corchorus olitorius]|uniref:Uncharacterized protein n=1 Tax=Corchorus olitorius TaxID=93759 RepID=A0A1R3L4T3_9ROSI|nr:hypothetical protein COLO4_00062 [Corchorus olitorius]